MLLLVFSSGKKWAFFRYFAKLQNFLLIVSERGDIQFSLRKHYDIFGYKLDV